ncbi:MAG: hypothetical protein H7Z72_22195 [Bacteroidetes bacterium]|nr:hypothetical protein [Fibrella sp.]
MSNKFNATALNEYTRSYARRVASDFYQHNTVISGKQILNLTPIGQINLFVVNSLFEKWKTDAEKFRSPYFDFTHPDVEEALRSFMNVVSQHIAVRREHLEPIVADAVRRTLSLLFDPRGYFDELLRELPEFTLTSSTARQLTRFTQIHKIIPVTIEQRMKGKSFIYANQALIYLDEVFAQHSHELDRYDKYVPMFGATIPLDLSALLRAHVPDTLLNGPTRSFFDDTLDHPDSQPKSIPAILSINQPVDAEMVTERPDAGYSAPEPMAGYSNGSSRNEAAVGGVHFLTDHDAGPEPLAPTAQPDQLSINVGVELADEPHEPDLSPSWSAVGRPEPETLNDRLREVTTSVAEHVSAPVATSVAEAFHQAPIESIGKSISLNQKFRFINQLFNGNSTAYSQAVQELDTMSNYGQALDLISYRYASQYLWDMSSDEVSELVEILKRRFA